MSQTVTVMASTKAGKAGGDDLVERAFDIVLSRSLMIRLMAVFGLNDVTTKVPLIEGCNFLTNALGVQEIEAMTWFTQVDTDGDSHIHIQELRTHVFMNWRTGFLYGEQYAVDRKVWTKLTAWELVKITRVTAGLEEGDFNISIPRPNLKMAVASISPEICKDEIDMIFATVKGDEGTESESDAITSSQLAAYFENWLIQGGYHTGQGSKASKSRAEDVHTNFTVRVLSRMLEFRVRLAVGQDLDSKEGIYEANFTQNFSLTFGVTQGRTLGFFAAFDHDASGAIDGSELVDSATKFSWNLLR